MDSHRHAKHDTHCMDCLVVSGERYEWGIRRRLVLLHYVTNFYFYFVPGYEVCFPNPLCIKQIENSCCSTKTLLL